MDYYPDMEGALYFPRIGLPNSAWLTNSLIYWDAIATITPRSFAHEPDEFDPYMRELVQEQLVHMAFPEGMSSLDLEPWLSGLPKIEVEARRNRLLASDFTPIHGDKFVYAEAFSQMCECGLARWATDRRWVEVERATALEYMSLLAVGLCHPKSALARSTGHRWVPVTDLPRAAEALLGGLSLVDGDEDNRVIGRRATGEQRVAEVRTVVLDSVLPYTDQQIPVTELVKFRRKHGSRLPDFRRLMELRLDEIINSGDAIQSQRETERLVGELEDLIEPVERYLDEAGFRRIGRSKLLTLVQVVPFVGKWAERVQKVANTLGPQSRVDENPLAYVAFARHELGVGRWVKSNRPSLLELLPATASPPDW